jgi:hypothetical protein
MLLPAKHMSHLHITSAGTIEQVFALTNSDSAEIVSPGHKAPLPETILSIHLHAPSLLIISFDARVFGLTSQTGKTNGPFLALNCSIDGHDCEPNTNSIEHSAPPGSGHGQSFTWIAHSVAAGSHTVEILATGINFGSLPNLIEKIVVTNRTLTVLAARLIHKAT